MLRPTRDHASSLKVLCVCCGRKLGDGKLRPVKEAWEPVIAKYVPGFSLGQTGEVGELEGFFKVLAGHKVLCLRGWLSLQFPSGEGGRSGGVSHCPPVVRWLTLESRLPGFVSTSARLCSTSVLVSQWSYTPRTGPAARPAQHQVESSRSSVCAVSPNMTKNYLKQRSPRSVTIRRKSMSSWSTMG